MRLVDSIIAVVGCATVGCAGLTQSCWDRTETAPTRPETLLRWSSSEQAKDNENNASGEEKENDDTTAKSPQQPATEDAITTDRPTFTPSSRAVGNGRVQLETGYTLYTGPNSGFTTPTHSYPEAELRIGMFADWFELRLTQNLLSTVAGDNSTTGPTDLLLGTRFWLTEKDKFLPESSLIIQTTVPSGSEAFINRKMLPGLILVYSWDLVPERVSLSGSSQANAAVDTTPHSYLQLAESLVLGYTFNPKLGAFAEWYAQLPYGAIAGIAPQYSFDSGFTYKFTNNFQLDIRAGLGLTHSADIFTGAGLSYRY
jgi:hypothetical protein